jgi:hypothetical protein
MMRKLTCRGSASIPVGHRLKLSCGSQPRVNSFSQSLFVLTLPSNSCILRMGRRYRLRFKVL